MKTDCGSMALESEAPQATPVPDNISTLPGGNPSYRKISEGFFQEQRHEASRLVASLQPKPLLSKLQTGVANLVSNLYFEAFSCVLFACFTLLVTVEFATGFPRLHDWETAVYESLYAANVALLSYFVVESGLRTVAFHSLCCSTLFGVDMALVTTCLALEVAAAACFGAAGGVGEKGSLFVVGNILKQLFILYKIRHYEFYYVIMAVFKNSRDRELIKLVQEKLQRVRSSLDPQSDEAASLNWIIYRIGRIMRMKRSHCSNANAEDEKVDFAGLDEETRRYLLETYSRKPTGKTSAVASSWPAFPGLY